MCDTESNTMNYESPSGARATSHTAPRRDSVVASTAGNPIDRPPSSPSHDAAATAVQPLTHAPPIVTSVPATSLWTTPPSESMPFARTLQHDDAHAREMTQQLFASRRTRTPRGTTGVTPYRTAVLQSEPTHTQTPPSPPVCRPDRHTRAVAAMGFACTPHRREEARGLAMTAYSTDTITDNTNTKTNNINVNQPPNRCNGCGVRPSEDSSSGASAHSREGSNIAYVAHPNRRRMRFVCRLRRVEIPRHAVVSRHDGASHASHAVTPPRRTHTVAAGEEEEAEEEADRAEAVLATRTAAAALSRWPPSAAPIRTLTHMRSSWPTPPRVTPHASPARTGYHSPAHRINESLTHVHSSDIDVRDGLHDDFQRGHVPFSPPPPPPIAASAAAVHTHSHNHGRTHPANRPTHPHLTPEGTHAHAEVMRSREPSHTTDVLAHTAATRHDMASSSSSNLFYPYSHSHTHRPSRRPRTHTLRTLTLGRHVDARVYLNTNVMRTHRKRVGVHTLASPTHASAALLPRTTSSGGSLRMSPCQGRARSSMRRGRQGGSTLLTHAHTHMHMHEAVSATHTTPHAAAAAAERSILATPHTRQTTPTTAHESKPVSPSLPRVLLMAEEEEEPPAVRTESKAGPPRPATRRTQSTHRRFSFATHVNQEEGEEDEEGVVVMMRERRVGAGRTCRSPAGATMTRDGSGGASALLLPSVQSSQSIPGLLSSCASTVLTTPPPALGAASASTQNHSTTITTTILNEHMVSPAASRVLIKDEEEEEVEEGDMHARRRVGRADDRCFANEPAARDDAMQAAEPSVTMRHATASSSPTPPRASSRTAAAAMYPFQRPELLTPDYQPTHPTRRNSAAEESRASRRTREHAAAGDSPIGSQPGAVHSASHNSSTTIQCIDAAIEAAVAAPRRRRRRTTRSHMEEVHHEDGETGRNHTRAAADVQDDGHCLTEEASASASAAAADDASASAASARVSLFAMFAMLERATRFDEFVSLQRLYAKELVPFLAAVGEHIVAMDTQGSAAHMHRHLLYLLLHPHESERVGEEFYSDPTNSWPLHMLYLTCCFYATARRCGYEVLYAALRRSGGIMSLGKGIFAALAVAMSARAQDLPLMTARMYVAAFYVGLLMQRQQRRLEVGLREVSYRNFALLLVNIPIYTLRQLVDEVNCNRCTRLLCGASAAAPPSPAYSTAGSREAVYSSDPYDSTRSGHHHPHPHPHNDYSSSPHTTTHTDANRCVHAHTSPYSNDAAMHRCGDGSCGGEEVSASVGGLSVSGGIAMHCLTRPHSNIEVSRVISSRSAIVCGHPLDLVRLDMVLTRYADFNGVKIHKDYIPATAPENSGYYNRSKVFDLLSYWDKGGVVLRARDLHLRVYSPVDGEVWGGHADDEDEEDTDEDEDAEKVYATEEHAGCSSSLHRDGDEGERTAAISTHLSSSIGPNQRNGQSCASCCDADAKGGMEQGDWAAGVQCCNSPGSCTPSCLHYHTAAHVNHTKTHSAPIGQRREAAAAARPTTAHHGQQGGQAHSSSRRPRPATQTMSFAQKVAEAATYRNQDLTYSLQHIRHRDVLLDFSMHALSVGPLIAWTNKDITILSMPANRVEQSVLPPPRRSSQDSVVIGTLYKLSIVNDILREVYRSRQPHPSSHAASLSARLRVSSSAVPRKSSEEENDEVGGVDMHTTFEQLGLLRVDTAVRERCGGRRDSPPRGDAHSAKVDENGLQSAPLSPLVVSVSATRSEESCGTVGAEEGIEEEEEEEEEKEGAGGGRQRVRAHASVKRAAANAQHHPLDSRRHESHNHRHGGNAGTTRSLRMRSPPRRPLCRGPYAHRTFYGEDYVVHRDPYMAGVINVFQVSATVRYFEMQFSCVLREAAVLFVNRLKERTGIDFPIYTLLICPTVFSLLEMWDGYDFVAKWCSDPIE